MNTAICKKKLTNSMNISIIACAENNYYERQHHFECRAGKFEEKILYYVMDYIL